MSGISLWLSPPSPSPLPRYLDQLSSKYHTASFAPHLTLVSDELVPSGYSDAQLLSIIQDGVQKWRSEGHRAVEIKFQEVTQGEKFYQCIFVKCKETHSLVSLHLELRKAFKLPPPTKESPYFPHLSLVYADLDSARKTEIIEEMKASGDVKGSSVVGMTEFVPTEILVMKTQGPPKDWKFIGQVDLTSESKI